MVKPTYFRIERSYEDADTGDCLTDEWPILYGSQADAIGFFERRLPADWFNEPTASFALSGLDRSGVEVSFARLPLVEAA